eukprot:1434590-Rhodomonas_salina.1
MSSATSSSDVERSSIGRRGSRMSALTCVVDGVVVDAENLEDACHRGRVSRQASDVRLSDSRHLPTRHPTSDIRHPTADIRHPTSDIRTPASTTRHQTPDTRHQTPDIT